MGSKITVYLCSLKYETGFEGERFSEHLYRGWFHQDRCRRDSRVQIICHRQRLNWQPGCHRALVVFYAGAAGLHCYTSG